MKYAIIIPDGAADDPLDVLNGKTPFEVAKKPFMDEVARTGRIGTARTVPDGFESGSDVATMSLLGYDPAVYHTGRAPLEAAAQRIPLSPSDWVFRCNFVTTSDGRMRDHSAGGISDAEADVLIKALSRGIQYPGFTFYKGVSYRNLLVYRGEERFEVVTRPPHEIPNEELAANLPKGPGSDVLKSIMNQSVRILDNHPINIERKKAGKNPATQAWLWGQGTAPKVPAFNEKFASELAGRSLKGGMITGVDLLRGLAVLLGWDVIDVPGITSFHDTDYAGQGRATAAALDTHDIVLSHIEAPDEASHIADHVTKIAAIEAIDQHVVGPVLAKLRTFPEWRLLVLPDHPTNIATRKHGYSPTIWAITGSGVKASNTVAYTEREAAKGEAFERGHELMGSFLR
ncbi:MAG: cofactor-independent phosphoglycerate mutase [Tepidisphaeraceae bacterium]